MTLAIILAGVALCIWIELDPGPPPLGWFDAEMGDLNDDP